MRKESSVPNFKPLEKWLFLETRIEDRVSIKDLDPGGVEKVGPGCQNGKFITVDADLNILKVYEFSIPSRLRVCQQRKIRATLEIIEYDCAQGFS